MLLSCEHVSLNFGGRELLDDVSFYLSEGDKVGMIGINGTGKSTFLNVLSGKLAPDRGTVSRDPNVQWSVLSQNPDMDDRCTLLEYVFLQTPEDFRQLQEYEAKTMLTRLGLPEVERKVGTLSGGQKKRLALAATLIHPADVLILDEPTNHLDSDMTSWLEEYLRKFRGGLVMVTHDRYFLERVVNHITELSRGKLYHYEANYSRYLELKEQRMEMALAGERKRQSILRVEREWIQRGCRARSTKSKDRIERYEQLRDQSAPETGDTVKLSAATSRLGRKLIELEHVSRSFEERTVIRDFSYSLLRNDRIGIVGVNGAGKSTLLHLIAGELLPDSGSVEIGTTVKIGHFSQEGKELDPEQRVYDFIHDIGDEVRTTEGTFTAKAMMEQFLFPSDLQRLPIGKLSGGERRRLYLLSILMSAPNVLLFDEPTNDLDIMTLSILENYLETFPGPVIVVSHDRFLLDRVAEQIFEIRDGEVLRTTGNWTDWQNKRKEEFSVPVENKAENSSRPVSERPRTERRLRFSFREQKEYETIDGDIAALEEQLQKCAAEQAKYCTDYVKLQELSEQQTALETALAEKEERWLYLQELKEKIDAQNG